MIRRTLVCGLTLAALGCAHDATPDASVDGGDGSAVDLRSPSHNAALPTFSEAAFSAGNWKHVDELNTLAETIPGFGSSDADTTHTLTARAMTYYVDPRDGSAENDGLSAKKPLLGFPGLANGYMLTASDVKYLVRAGTILPHAEGGGGGFLVTGSDVTIGVYDGEPSSPGFGQEIIDQPDPFTRARAHAWVSRSELGKSYFTIDAGRPPDNTDESTGVAALATQTMGHVVIRGVYFTNYSAAALLARGGAYVRVEDSVVGRCNRDPLRNSSKFGGNGMRIDDATNGATLDVARVFMDTGAEDQFWIWYKKPEQKFILSDFAIIADMANQKYGVQHGDIVQASASLGDYTVRRGVIEHRQDRPGYALPGGMTDLYQGKGFIGTGDTGTLPVGSPLLEDLLYASSFELLYFERQTNLRFRRIGVVAIAPPDGSTGARQVNLGGGAGGVEESTRYDFVAPRMMGRTFFAPSTPASLAITDSNM